MSTQGIIVILLSVIGFLIVSWIGIAATFIKDKLGKHDERLDSLEEWREDSLNQNKEMLDILRGLKDVG